MIPWLLKYRSKQQVKCDKESVYCECIFVFEWESERKKPKTSTLAPQVGILSLFGLIYLKTKRDRDTETKKKNETIAKEKENIEI